MREEDRADRRLEWQSIKISVEGQLCQTKLITGNCDVLSIYPLTLYGNMSTFS